MSYNETLRLARIRQEIVRTVSPAEVDRLVAGGLDIAEHRMGAAYLAKHNCAVLARTLVETRNASRTAWNLSTSDVADAITPDCRYWKR